MNGSIGDSLRFHRDAFTIKYPVHDWYERDRQPVHRIPEKGKGLQIEGATRELGIDRGRDDGTVVLLMPHGVVQRGHSFESLGGRASRIGDTVFVRMPYRFDARHFDRDAFAPEMIIGKQARLTRYGVGGDDRVYFPPKQEQRDLYDAGLMSISKVNEAVAAVFGWGLSLASFTPGCGRVAEQQVMETGLSFALSAWGYCRGPGRLVTYRFLKMDGSFFLTGEQVERAVRWFYLPDTVSLS